MTTKIALFGAGGKMGYRLASNLKRGPFEVGHVERSPAGQEHLKSGLGLECVPTHEALQGAEVVILAVPDTAIGKVAAIDRRGTETRNDGHGARRRCSLRRPSAEARRPGVFRYPSLPSAAI